jgi:transglutaminase-like putative cysteine protease
MAAVVNRSYLQASSTNLATDLARYGSAAEWRGVYYRGEKIGFTVTQTVPLDDGFELQEDGRLQMALLGATTAARIRTTARVDRAFALRSFEFSLDPGTGPLEVRGTVDGLALDLSVTTPGGTRTERRELAEPPMLGLNLARRLASEGLKAGARHEWAVFDPATLSNAPMNLTVGSRENIGTESRGVIPAFRVEMEFAGLRTTSWITDTGEVVREESPLGLITAVESADHARAMAVAPRNRTDMIEAAAVKPVMKQRIDEPRNVRRLRMRIEGADLSGPDLQGAGQVVEGDIVELSDPQGLRAMPADLDVTRYLQPEPFIESDDPEIIREAMRAVAGAKGARGKAEQLTRYVNAVLEKKPTVSLPSAREVLRTRVGDCNEHTVLFVAMARAAGIPARIAVGLTFVRGAFYYHAWPEVYLDEGKGRGLWLPVDPTLNQFPADATHLRLARGGLDKQTAILPLIGKIKMTVLDLELAPGSVPVIVGRAGTDMTPLSIALPTRTRGDCWTVGR